MDSAVHPIESYVNRKRSVRGLQFGILSPEEILRNSVAHIHRPIASQRKKKEKDDGAASSLEGTPSDPRMGVTERGTVNPLTMQNYRDDPGYIGHIVLAKPVYLIHFLPYIIKILNMVCFKCSALRVDTDNSDVMREIQIRSGRTRFEYVYNKATNVTCPNCGFHNPKFQKDTHDSGAIANIIAVFSKTAANKNVRKIEHSINPTSALEILRRITDSDCRLMGLNPKTSRPEWTIWTVMPVPSPTMRPAVKQDFGRVGQNDLTCVLNDIVKYNSTLYQLLDDQDSLDSANNEETERKIKKFWTVLQYLVATFIDNSNTGLPANTNKAGRPLVTVRQRLSAKAGRVRGNLMGKRVNYSARSVITPDPNLSVSEVGVPRKMAMKLDYPETVTSRNIEHLNRLVSNGPHQYPGARKVYVRGVNEGMINLKAASLGTALKIGDIVYRHMMDGDVVLFNRQPTLHRMGMMCHTVRVLPDGNTLRMNVQDTSPYNADFDGDEMNIFIPRTPASSIELKILASVTTQTVSPQASKPVMGMVQDGLTACWRFSRQNPRISLQQMMRLVSWIVDFDGVISNPKGYDDGIPYWDAKDVLSMIMPRISVHRKNLKVSNGRFESGILDKSNVGAKANSLIHITSKDHGPDAVRDLFDNLSNITTQWLLMDGFSVGVSDIKVNPVVKQKVAQIIKDGVQDTSENIERVHSGKYTLKDFTTVSEQFENDMVGKLQQVTDKATKTVENLTSAAWLLFVSEEIGDKKFANDKERDDELKRLITVWTTPKTDEKERKDWDERLERLTQRTYDMLDNIEFNNRIMSTITSGSKGSMTNLGQIMACLGQQIIEGNRVRDFYEGRPIPHVARGSLKAEDRGYIKNGFEHGLSPNEYIYHAMAGRVGVISTSIKTAETGYIQRKLVKIMEDLCTLYDSTARNAHGRIIQFVYGGDGMDGSMVEEQSVDYISMNSSEMFKKYGWSSIEIDTMDARLTPDALRTLRDHDNYMDVLNEEYDQMVNDKRTLIFERSVNHQIPTLYSPINYQRLLQSHSDRFNLEQRGFADLDPVYIIESVKKLLNERLVITPDEEIQEYNMFIFKAITRAYMCTKNLIRMKFDKSSFDHLIEEIEWRFYRSTNSPGDSVGIIAAQSIGEPATQLTLDTFHQTGVAGVSRVSVQGVPRIRELLSITHRQKQPSCSVYLKNDQEYAKNLEHNIDYQWHKERQLTTDEESFWDLKKKEADGHRVYSLERAKSYMPKLEYTTFSDMIAPPVQIFFDSSRDSESIIEKDRDVLMTYWTILGDEEPEFPQSRWVIRFNLNRESRFLKGDFANIVNIMHKLNLNLESESIVVSPETENGEMFVRIRCNNEMTTQELTRLKNDILKFHFSGVEGITRVYEREMLKDVLADDHIKSRYDINHKDPDARRVSEFILDTKGTNLAKILALDEVDTFRTISNDVHEIHEIFGIEAARSALISEIMGAMSAGGASLGIRHVELLADAMTFKGVLVSVDRHGIGKGDSGPLARASFEETSKQLTMASFFGESENMMGVSSNVIFGQLIQAGTNAFGILLDEEMLASVPIPAENMPPTETLVSSSDLKAGSACDVNSGFKFEF